MGFTDFLSRLSSTKALPPSYYDEEFVVASIDKIPNILSNRDHSNLVKVNSVVRTSVAVKQMRSLKVICCRDLENQAI